MLKTKVIAIANKKGGVGKTTTVISLGHGLALRDKKVLLVDLDFQGSLAFWLNLEKANTVASWIRGDRRIEEKIVWTNRENMWLLRGWEETATLDIVNILYNSPISFFRDLMKPFIGQYDYIIFDTSPSLLGGFQIRSIWASDLLIIPTVTEAGAVAGIAELLHDLAPIMEAKNENIKWSGKLLGILPTFYKDTTVIRRHFVHELEEAYGASSILHPIRESTVMEQAVGRGKTVFEVDPKSKPAVDYEYLVDMVLRVKK